jgi:hypothetical protein
MRLFPSFATAMPALVLLSSCVGPTEQRPEARPTPAPVQHGPAPAPVAANPPAAAAPVEWQYRPVTPGAWTYRADGATALFGQPGAAPLLLIQCDRAGRRVSLVRAGAGQGTMTVRTSLGAQIWPAASASGQTVATRAANDGGLDQIAYSRGKVMVEVAGLAPLIVPAWAEISRVIEDCR